MVRLWLSFSADLDLDLVLAMLPPPPPTAQTLDIYIYIYIYIDIYIYIGIETAIYLSIYLSHYVKIEHVFAFQQRLLVQFLPNFTPISLNTGRGLNKSISISHLVPLRSAFESRAGVKASL